MLDCCLYFGSFLSCWLCLKLLPHIVLALWMQTLLCLGHSLITFCVFSEILASLEIQHRFATHKTGRRKHLL